MENEGIDALIVPTDDPHMSEYVAPHFARREFVSGFTGSAAELELSNEWTLMRSGLKDVPSLSDYLQQKLSTGSVLGLDPFVHAAEPSIKLEKRKNPIDVVWGSHRPSKPANMIRLHSNKFAGKSSMEKIASVREKMKEKGAEYLVVSALDEIAWLYNIRGGDIPCNPVSICYAILGTEVELAGMRACHLRDGAAFAEFFNVTRTFHTGTPTQYQKEMFTRVLKGNIGVDSRVFPTGTPGCQLDTFARTALWEVGKNYNHGTGHGVGAALNDSQPLIPGMIVSNEPGYYEPGNFGIRIENLLVVVEKPELGEFGGRKFLGFDRLTHIPIAKNLLVRSLLTKQEEKWIDDYHNDVWTKVSPLLLSDRARAWLREATRPLLPNQ
eukprot:gene31374-40760_t